MKESYGQGLAVTRGSRWERSLVRSAGRSGDSSRGPFSHRHRDRDYRHTQKRQGVGFGHRCHRQRVRRRRRHGRRRLRLASDRSHTRPPAPMIRSVPVAKLSQSVRASTAGLHGGGARVGVRAAQDQTSGASLLKLPLPLTALPTVNSLAGSAMSKPPLKADQLTA